jgi:hypothetical protein
LVSERSGRKLVALEEHCVATVRSRKPGNRKSDDMMVIAAATFAVLLVGALIAVGLYVGSSRGNAGKSPVCAPLRVGAASDIRQSLQNEGPSFYTGGGSCGFWLALDSGDIVAYKVQQPSGCSLNLRTGERWVCGGRTVDPTRLAQYPVSIETLEKVDIVVVNLSPTATTTTGT